MYCLLTQDYNIKNNINNKNPEISCLSCNYSKQIACCTSCNRYAVSFSFIQNFVDVNIMKNLLRHLPFYPFFFF